MCNMSGNKWNKSFLHSIRSNQLINGLVVDETQQWNMQGEAVVLENKSIDVKESIASLHLHLWEK